MISGLSPDQVETILLHELAHIRRHDFAVNFAQSVIEVILFSILSSGSFLPTSV